MKRVSKKRFAPYCLVVPLLICLAWVPVLPRGPAEQQGNPRVGRDIFFKKGCIRCHSIWNAQKKKGPDLSSVGMGRNLYDLCASIWSHWQHMNALLGQDRLERVTLQPSDFRDIIAYLYYLNYYSEPGKTELGGEIFVKKGCVRCHALEPHQDVGMAGRPIYRMSEFQAPIALAVAVWNHGGEMVKRMAKLVMPWPQFKDKEVAHLVAFIRSRNGSPKTPRMVIPGDSARGRALFKSKSCAACHSPGSGRLRQAPDLGASAAAVSVNSLIGSLWNHYPGMFRTITARGVSYPKIKREEMEDILAYVYGLKAYRLGGSALNGRRLYESKQCATCHSPSSGAQAPAPKLIASEKTRSVYSLLAAIWNHGPKMESLLRQRHLPWPELTGKEMRDLIAFFRQGAASKTISR